MRKALMPCPQLLHHSYTTIGDCLLLMQHVRSTPPFFHSDVISRFGRRAFAGLTTHDTTAWSFRIHA